MTCVSTSFFSFQHINDVFESEVRKVTGVGQTVAKNEGHQKEEETKVTMIGRSLEEKKDGGECPVDEEATCSAKKEGLVPNDSNSPAGSLGRLSSLSISKDDVTSPDSAAETATVEPYECVSGLYPSRWTIPLLFAAAPKLSLVVDLTATTKYYNPKEMYKHAIEEGFKHTKILTKGHVIPDKNVIKK